MKPKWISIFLFLAGCAAGWMGTRLFERESRNRRDIVVRTDTVVVTDTVIERMPEPVAMSVVDTLHIPVMDTVLYSVKDTLYVRDTLYVELPREQKFYSADDYRVWVSGYRPRLDSIAVFPSAVYVDRERGTVADVYAKIADDIEDGYPLIDDTRFTQPKYHFNKAAAAAFAAQFFLYYGDYEKAVYYATEAIGTDPTPLYRDWSLYTGTSVDEYANAYISTDEAANFLNQGYNSIANRIVMGRFIMTEPIATSEILGSTPWGNVASLDIGTAYSYSSRAYLLPKQTEYFIITDAVSQTGTPYCVNVVFTSEKTMIDRAEAYALDGNYGAAATDLNHFYHSLGLTATLTADEISAYYSTATVNNPVLAPKGLTLSDGLQTNLVKACIHARRIMTVQEGGRLLDLKRYGIAYTHELDGEAPVNVQPYDLRLAIQLPSAVVSAGMTPNPR